MDDRDRLAALLTRHGVAAGSESMAQFQLYLALLCRWNERMNLTASTEWRLLGPLFQEALWAAGRYPDGGQRHLDFGSGAGFPALAMKVVLPGMVLDLVESRRKKAVFLETVVRELGLQGVGVHCRRLGQFLAGEAEHRSWDCISWKGMRPAKPETDLLAARAGRQTRLWVFHGREIPVESERAWEDRFERLQTVACPGRRGSYLSVYAKRG